MLRPSTIDFGKFLWTQIHIQRWTHCLTLFAMGGGGGAHLSPQQINLLVVGASGVLRKLIFRELQKKVF